MNLFEQKAIEWLKSLVNVRSTSDESFYAQLILKQLEQLDGRSVAEIIEENEALSSKVEDMLDVLAFNDIVYED